MVLQRIQPGPEFRHQGSEPYALRPEVDLDAAVAHINAIHLKKGLETAVEIGDYVIATFFGGNSHKSVVKQKLPLSFRKLADHAGLNVSYSLIWNAVNVVYQMRTLPTEVARALPFTHHTMLLPIQDPEEKERLARVAIRGGLSKRQFAAEVATASPAKTPSSRGRPRLPQFVRAISDIVAAECQWASEPVTREAVKRFSYCRTSELTAECEIAISKLQQLLAALTAIIEEEMDD